MWRNNHEMLGVCVCDGAEFLCHFPVVQLFTFCPQSPLTWGWEGWVVPVAFIWDSASANRTHTKERPTLATQSRRICFVPHDSMAVSFQRWPPWRIQKGESHNGVVVVKVEIQHCF